MNPDPLPSLDEVSLWIDPVPRDGPTHMAIDEWLLTRSGTLGAILRTYLWDAPACSIGYRQDPSVLPAGCQHWVRRWTGGGLVAHGGGDATYALVLPPGSRLGRQRPRDGYAIVHAALAAALGRFGQETLLWPVSPSESTGAGPGLSNGAADSEACFRSPVAADLVAPDGLAKVAGAAQRRTRRGILQQGSVQSILPPDWGEAFASELASKVRALEESVRQEAVAAAPEIAHTRYRQPP